MNENRIKRNRALAQRVIKGLESRNMEGYYAETKQEALKIALDLIPEGSTIGWGGSMSVGEIGLKDAVCSGNYNIIDRDSAPTPEEKRARELAIMDADWFLCSSNAITEDGVLVNIDGHGNRVASIIVGPRNVLMIVGMNKVRPDVDAAVSRARNEAAPINKQRFAPVTPCMSQGYCSDCKSPGNICCQFLITRFSMDKGRIKVVLVGDDLGF